LAAAGLVVAVSGCGATHRTRLADGSTAPVAPHVLRHLDHAAMTRTRVLTLAEAETAGLHACLLMSRATRVPKPAAVIERITRAGASFTVRTGATALFACDMARDPTGGAPRPCAVAVGKVLAGRLLDPRLTLRCGFGKARPLAFAWITPLRRTRWVVVRTSSGVEIYATAGGLPVRVAATEGVSAPEASATFEVEQRGADGQVLMEETERVVVAG
jgi:hypothetical protein